ncbi:MAG: hypothetical protein JNL18_04610 [Planctomycetaceae bacterium]|nr:hypothetical protein [Planctomycetaceae bacterium]
MRNPLMFVKHRSSVVLALLLGLVTARVSAQAPAGYVTSFEGPGPTEVTYPAGYTTGTLQFQDGWTGSGNFPRVQTADEISAELTAAGLNPANSVHSGNQALLAAKVDTNVETTGYFVENIFTTGITAFNVIVDYWARPLTSGLGADPAGTPPGNGKTIGERQGNTFVGIMDDSRVRAAAVRFGVDTSGSDPYTNVLERHIDFASASAGTAVWVKSGLLWQADQWYNFKFDLDYVAKTYDFYVNGAKVNVDPIRFYTETSTAATRFFVSRGTNQAGQIIDDVSVLEKTTSPGDFNQDGVVDGADFLAWQQDTNIGSLEDWKANFGASATAAVGAVPEPTSAMLATSMLLLTVGCRLARRRPA